jgi:hypothetical protein
MTTIEMAGISWRAWLVRLLASPRTRALLLTALALLYAGCVIYIWQRGIADLIDFNAYYISAYGFAHGEDIYALGEGYRTTNWPRWQALAAAAGVEQYTVPYLYPPLTAQLILPLLRFSEFEAGVIWLALTGIAFTISAWWLGRVWAQPEGPSIVYLLALAFAPPLITMREGQVNGFVLLALVAGYVGLSRSKWLLAGGGLAIAALVKLVPIVLCLYLGWRKQWLAAAAAALVMVGLLLTAPLTLGSNVLVSYAEHFGVTTRVGVLYRSFANQGLSGFWVRALAPGIDDASIYRIYLASALLIVLATITLCWPLRKLPSVWRLEYGLIICALLLIPPYTWYHTLTALLIPLVIVVERLWRAEHWGLLAIVVVLLVGMSLPGLLYRHVAIPYWLSLFPFTLVLLLWGLLAWMIVAERKAASLPRPIVSPG